MKLNISASALLFSAMLFSCTVEIDTPEVEVTKVNDYVITAYSEGSATKAELSSDNSVLWQKGDKISVLSMVDGVSPANDLFTLESGEQTTSGTFRGSLSNPELSHVGVYPYNNNHMYGAIGSLSWGKDVQIATKDDFDPEAFLMAGQMDADAKISFKNICSYIKFTTDFACESIEITSNPNPNNASDIKHLVSDIVSFTFDDNGFPVSISPVEGYGQVYNTVKLVGQYDEEGYSKLIPAGTYYVAVLPQEYYGLTFTFNTEFGKTIEKSTKSGAQIKIERNTIANVGTFPLDKLLPVGSNGFSGKGTADEPYLISSLEKLQLLATQFSDHKNYPSYTKDTYFLQTKDINCEGQEVSIGSMKTDDDQALGLARYYYPFTGIYDGGGYTITNYKLKECKGEPGYVAGLFNNIYQGSIKNLTVAPAVGGNNLLISSDKNGKLYVGALIGTAGHHPTDGSTGEGASVTVSNCHLIGGPYNVNASRSKYFGGLVGYSCGDFLRLENCTNSASLSTADGVSGTAGLENVVGGLIGGVSFSYNGGESSGSHSPLLEIAKCRNNGNVSAFSDYLPCFAGGLVGLWCDYYSPSSAWNNLEAHVSNSVNAGNVIATTGRTDTKYVDVSDECGPACAGGFFGFFGADESTSYFHNCLNKGSIEAYSPQDSYHARAGGFLGFSKENNNVSQGNQSGSKDHVYAALCVNIGPIIGKDKGSFCGTVNGMKCVGCLWLDQNDYDAAEAAIPYRPGIGRTADTSVDDYYYNQITKEIIYDLCNTMLAHNNNTGSYPNYAQTLRWGTPKEWKEWAVAWTGEAIWNSTWAQATKTLDLDLSKPIEIDINPNE